MLAQKLGDEKPEILTNAWWRACCQLHPNFLEEEALEIRDMELLAARFCAPETYQAVRKTPDSPKTARTLQRVFRSPAKRDVVVALLDPADWHL